jgi:hypothetical protein
MDPTNFFNSQEEKKMEIEDFKADQIHIAILTTLTRLQAELRHLGEMFAEHREDRSKLGERVGELEKAMPNKLDERLARLEIIVIGKMAVVAALILCLIPIAWPEIKTTIQRSPPTQQTP